MIQLRYDCQFTSRLTEASNVPAPGSICRYVMGTPGTWCVSLSAIKPIFAICAVQRCNAALLRVCLRDALFCTRVFTWRNQSHPSHRISTGRSRSYHRNPAGVYPHQNVRPTGSGRQLHRNRHRLQTGFDVLCRKATRHIIRRTPVAGFRVQEPDDFSTATAKVVIAVSGMWSTARRQRFPGCRSDGCLSSNALCATSTLARLPKIRRRYRLVATRFGSSKTVLRGHKSA